MSFSGIAVFLVLPRYSLRSVCWSRLRRVTFQRWKVTKDRRACGPGPRVGAKSAPFRFRLKPKTALRSFAPPSPHRTRFAGLRRGPPRGGGGGDYGACKSFGCYPPFWLVALNTSAAQCGPSGGYPPCKTCRQFRWRGWSTCRLSDCHLLLDGFVLSRCGKKPIALCFCK